MGRTNHFSRWCLLALGLAGTIDPNQARPVVAGYERMRGASHATDTSARSGLLLLNELQCGQCHAAAPVSILHRLPVRRGPHLDAFGTRIKASWLREFLNNPSAAHRGSAMPNLLHGLDAATRQETVEDMVHYLMSEPGPPRPVIRFADAAFGQRLYREIGCAACHPADPLAERELPERTVSPFPDLEAKYTLESLTDFLLNPLRHRPDGRMPRMGLSREEAVDVAAYLTRYAVETESAPVPFNVDAERAERGRRAFAEIGCANCHARGEMKSELSAPPLAQLNPRAIGGCLNKPAPGLPDYSLAADRVAALQTALGELNDTLTPQARLDLHLHSLQCLACHERNGRGGISTHLERFLVGDELLGDAGRFPPPLTQAGAKLTEAWLTRVLQGKAATRPYLRLRMPDFGWSNVAALPALFAAADFPDGPRTNLPIDDANAEDGRRLIGTDHGMGCITCHGWKDRPGLTMNAIHLGATPERLRPDWFRKYLIDPAAYRPSTLMPAFWPEGISSHPGVLAGDTDRQIAAIWKFLAEGTETPSGYPAEQSNEFELAPADTALVQRGFISPAGTHAIAVGFPEDVHVVFDAEQCRPVAMWRGRFLDAYKLWFSRQDPTAAPLGDEMRMWPAGFPLLASDHDLTEARFRGYRLTGPRRIPEFLYDLGPITVRDKLEPNESRTGIRRVLHLRSRDNAVAMILRLNDAEGLRVAVEGNAGAWTVTGDRETKLVLEYLWK